MSSQLNSVFPTQLPRALHGIYSRLILDRRELMVSDYLIGQARIQFMTILEKIVRQQEDETYHSVYVLMALSLIKMQKKEQAIEYCGKAITYLENELLEELEIDKKNDILRELIRS